MAVGYYSSAQAGSTATLPSEPADNGLRHRLGWSRSYRGTEFVVLPVPQARWPRIHRDRTKAQSHSYRPDPERRQARAAQSSRRAHVIATETQDLTAAVPRITDRQGARVILDPVGGPIFAKLADATSVDDILVVYGTLGADPTSLPIVQIQVKHLTIRGIQWSH